MKLLSQRLTLINGVSADTAARLLIPALRHARPSERDQICGYLVDRRSETAMIGLLCGIQQLGSHAQRALESWPEGLERAIQAVWAGGDAQSIRNALSFIAAADLVVGVECAAGTAGAADRELAAAGADALLALTLRIAGPHGRMRRNPSDRHRLDRAVAMALRQAPARLDGSALQALALAAIHPGPVLAAALAQLAGEMQRAMRGAVTRTIHPLVRRNLVDWLATPALATSAGRAIESVGGDSGVADVLERAFLLRVPSRRRALRALTHPERALPGHAVSAGLPAAAQRGVAIMIESLALRDRRRIDRLGECAASSDVVARAAALRALSRLDEPSAVDAIASFAFDPVAPIAGTAAARLVGDRSEACTVLRRLVRSPHPRVERLALTHAALRSPPGLLANLTRVDRDTCAVAFRLAIVADRSVAIRGVRTVLASGSVEERVIAVGLLQRSNLASEAEQELLELASSTSPHVAAAAVRALGQIEGVAARRALCSALRSADPRVKANAIESLVEREGSSALPLIEPILDGRAARARANAVLAFLREACGGESQLRTMLFDPDPSHRLSALWVASRSPRRALAEDLDHLARQDESAAVRVRAAQALRLVARRAAAITEASA